MIGKCLFLAAATFTTCAALGYGEASVRGAWAFATNPDKTCFVVTNGTVWVLKDGAWTPSVAISPSDRGLSFRLVDESDYSNRQVLWVRTKRDRKHGYWTLDEGDILEGEVIWAREKNSPKKITYLDKRKVVKAKMPDWRAIRNEKLYYGTWKPIGKDRGSGGGSMQKHDDEYLVKIRDDRTIVTYRKGHKPEKYSPEPYTVETWTPVDGGLQVGCKRLWLAPSGTLVSCSSTGTTTLVRTGETFDDPIEARTRMAARKAFHGVWGVNVEFNIKILRLDRNGRGVLNGFMSMVPFKWGVRKDGAIRCVLDADMMPAQMQGNPSEFVCRYDIRTNEMEMETPPNEDEGEIEPTRNRLPFMSWEPHTDECFARIDELKKSPQFRMEMEWLRNRPPETPEERERRRMRAAEKRLARERAAKEEAERKAEKERRKKLRRDVIEHYDQAVRNDVYYSETDSIPACYLQHCLIDSEAGSAEDNHVVVSHIKANPKLLTRYCYVVAKESLQRDDLDWLFQAILAEYRTSGKSELLRVMFGAKYDELSRQQYEEAFQALPDDDLLKATIHADARSRFRKFHPDWRSAYRSSR